jgi:hypothetical protein
MKKFENDFLDLSGLKTWLLQVDSGKPVEKEYYLLDDIPVIHFKALIYSKSPQY